MDIEDIEEEGIEKEESIEANIETEEDIDDDGFESKNRFPRTRPKVTKFRDSEKKGGFRENEKGKKKRQKDRGKQSNRTAEEKW